MKTQTSVKSGELVSEMQDLFEHWQNSWGNSWGNSWELPTNSWGNSWGIPGNSWGHKDKNCGNDKDSFWPY